MAKDNRSNREFAVLALLALIMASMFVTVVPSETEAEDMSTLFRLEYRSDIGTNIPSTQTYITDDVTVSTHVFTISSKIPVDKTKTFLGWTTTEGGTQVQYTPGQSITVSADMTTVLYGVWLNDDTFTFILTLSDVLLLLILIGITTIFIGAILYKNTMMGAKQIVGMMIAASLGLVVIAIYIIPAIGAL